MGECIFAKGKNTFSCGDFFLCLLKICVVKIPYHIKNEKASVFHESFTAIRLNEQPDTAFFMPFDKSAKKDEIIIDKHGA